MWGPRGWTRSAIGLTLCTTDLFSVNKPRGSQSDFGLIGLDSIKEVSMLLCIPSFCLVFEQFSHLSKRCANESQELNVNPTLHCAVFSVSWAFWPVMLSWSVSGQVCKLLLLSFPNEVGIANSISLKKNWLQNAKKLHSRLLDIPFNLKIPLVQK